MPKLLPEVSAWGRTKIEESQDPTSLQEVKEGFPPEVRKAKAHLLKMKRERDRDQVLRGMRLSFHRGSSSLTATDCQQRATS